jgi:hypothetical protein
LLYRRSYALQKIGSIGDLRRFRRWAFVIRMGRVMFVAPGSLQKQASNPSFQTS